MDGSKMKTSDVEKALNKLITWKQFCRIYQEDKQNFLSRADGIITSGDFRMKFDSGNFVVTNKHIKELMFVYEEKEIISTDLEFIANVILLCGFEFQNDISEDTLVSISEG